MPPEPAGTRTAHETRDQQDGRFGMLAGQSGRKLPLEVCSSRAGFYLGTLEDSGDLAGAPFTRESENYWRKREDAARALRERTWTQRQAP